MKYHIDTIPVWDAVKHAKGCPLCAFQYQTEKRLIERSLGGSVMEPSSRIRANQTGFCARHHQMLYALQNRLGHALLLQSRLQYLIDHPDQVCEAPARPAKAWFFSAAKEESAPSRSCVVCEDLKENMGRFVFSMLHLYKTDAAFHTAFEAMPPLCLAHTAALSRMANEALSEKERKTFLDTLKTRTLAALQSLKEDVDAFTLSFDYRNPGPVPEKSRDAVERAVNLLRGHTLGRPPMEEDRK